MVNYYLTDFRHGGFDLCIFPMEELHPLATKRAVRVYIIRMFDRANEEDDTTEFVLVDDKVTFIVIN